MKRITGLLLAALTGLVLLYLSRFWVFSFWSRDGLWGLKEIRPQGDMVSRWLQGTELAPFELLLWAVGVFLVLTWAEKIYGWFRKDEH